MLGYYPVVICVTIALHLIWALGLAMEPAAINATALHTLLVIAKSPHMAAAIYAGVAMLAIVGMAAPSRYARVILILPQQAVLWFSVVGAAYAMFLGQFADGVQRAHWFLIVDQVPVILIAVGHTAALLLIAGDKGHA